MCYKNNFYDKFVMLSLPELGIVRKYLARISKTISNMMINQAQYSDKR